MNDNSFYHACENATIAFQQLNMKPIRSTIFKAATLIIQESKYSMAKFNSNIVSFLTAANSSGPGTLVGCYCKLVAIELCLKSHCPLTSGHDIKSLIASYLATVLTAPAVVLNTSVTPAAAGRANSLLTNFDNAIFSIWVTKKSGVAGRASASSYPDIRYVRFKADLWIPLQRTVEPAHLTILQNSIDAILHFVRTDLGMPI